MDSFLLILFGYIGWCFIAFIVARFVKLESANSKGIPLLYVLLAAPMVIIDMLTGKGSIR
ncbi:hypothetical protein GCM10008107_13630 [Psychrosphaera saromensis]|uniref:Uncharacterized protein n=1 Tax=Psychrosphaera saromensis TaxID=716813 RepID=A0A2S7UTU5_9GAMM|nr:hypothetical protein BTO11_06765 [Psychrosphaera saromensis]GHB65873.1 hypothetical protein GCM10008107_13630 [Psychrosphaera saromensis]GLQ14819.1 hypothetical protein GCM10007917_22740 [Psychrosphaera saromensis]